MTKTRSTEMKIEREKGYVWFLVGMSMRSVIWNRFRDPKWSQNNPNAGKMLPERFQFGSRRPLEPKLASGALPSSISRVRSNYFRSENSPKSDVDAFQNRLRKRVRNKLALKAHFPSIFGWCLNPWKQIFYWNWRPLLSKFAWHWKNTNSWITM